MIKLLQKIKRKLSPPIDITDGYIQALRSLNAGEGMLQPGNLYCIDHAMKHLPTEGCLLEIGSFGGLSTNVINYYRQKYNRPNSLFAVDKWEFEPIQKHFYEKTLNIPASRIQDFVKESFMRNVKFFHQDALPYAIELFSDDFFKNWEEKANTKDLFGREIKLGGALAFCYIDGDHTYEFAKRDFENCARYLSPGGFILFDDSADFSNFGVGKLMEEIKRDNSFELVIKNPNYLFRKKRI
jgi:SAM-dependent methyltransferase